MQAGYPLRVGNTGWRGRFFSYLSLGTFISAWRKGIRATLAWKGRLLKKGTESQDERWVTAQGEPGRQGETGERMILVRLIR